MAAGQIWVFAAAASLASPGHDRDPLVDPLPADDAADGPRILLLSSGLPADDVRKNAMRAHLGGTGMQLQPTAWQPEPAQIDRYHQARGHAAHHDGDVVLWVEEPSPGVMTLYLVDPERDELRQRTMTYPADERETSLEALGVITRSILTAWSEGAPLEMDRIAMPAPEPEPQPQPQPPPEPQPEPRGRFLLGASYVGTSYAPQAPWQSGLRIETGWAWPVGVEAGLGYSVLQGVRARADETVLLLRRHPVDAFAGYAHQFRNLRIHGSAAVIVDPTRRSASTTAQDLVAQPDRNRVAIGLGPRARLSVFLVWRLELFVGVGMEVWLREFRYELELDDGSRARMVDPWRVRAWTVAGLVARI